MTLRHLAGGDPQHAVSASSPCTERFPMAEGSHAAEANCNRFTSAGDRGIVLRSGWFHGPGATHREEGDCGDDGEAHLRRRLASR